MQARRGRSWTASGAPLAAPWCCRLWPHQPERKLALHAADRASKGAPFQNSVQVGDRAGTEQMPESVVSVYDDRALSFTPSPSPP